MNHIFVLSLACLFCVPIEVSASASEVGKNQNLKSYVRYNKQMTIRIFLLPVMLIAIAALVLRGANSRGLDIDGNGVNYRHRDENSK
jgi:hypothetical protein